jgi:hypothetical protein
MECAWRILGNAITSKEPAVHCVPIHLPDRNIPKFRTTISDPINGASPLIRYFNRPLDLIFRHLTILDYYQEFVLYNHLKDPKPDTFYYELPITNAVPNIVCPQKYGIKTCRLQIVSPTAGEIFYLRALLLHKPCRSFEEILTFDDIQCPNFHEAALRMGLFNHENEGAMTMTEAVSYYHTPTQLRFLFGRLILEGYPAQPLWDEFTEHLAKDDIAHFKSHELGTNTTLQRISDFLQENDHTLSDFGLPQVTIPTPEIFTERLADSNRHQQLHEIVQTKTRLMNTEQADIYHEILLNIVRYDNRTPCSPVFLEGKPGRGKTYVVDTLCCDIRSRNLIVLVVGTTALAATLSEGGRTAHNLFRVPVTEVSHILNNVDHSPY